MYARNNYTQERDHSLIAELRTDVSDVDILQRLVGLQITNLDNERVGAIVLASDEQLGHNHGMVGSATQRADPPLRGSQGRRVDCESFVVRVPSGCCFQATDVGTMAQFRLCVTSNDLVFRSWFKEELLLLRGSLFP